MLFIWLCGVAVNRYIIGWFNSKNIQLTWLSKHLSLISLQFARLLSLGVLNNAEHSPDVTIYDFPRSTSAAILSTSCLEKIVKIAHFWALNDKNNSSRGLAMRARFLLLAVQYNGVNLYFDSHSHSLYRSNRALGLLVFLSLLYNVHSLLFRLPSSFLFVPLSFSLDVRPPKFPARWAGIG